MSIDNALSVIQSIKSTQQKEVHLNFQELSEIPDALWELTEITHLFLTGNNIDKIPDDIQQLTQLQYLDISANKLVRLPDSILKLEKLNTLDISSNSLSQLPFNINQFRNLTTLDCFDNCLTKLPEAIGDCLNLTTLRMGKNELTELPSTIGRLSHLDTLDASYNEIEQLPASIRALTKLENLDLAGNKIDLPFSFFEKYQYDPNILFEKIREIEYKKSHTQLDRYREQKENKSIESHVYTLDNILKQFPIINNQLHIKITHTSKPKTLHNTAQFLEALNNDLLIVWSITHSIQGIADKHCHANPLMNRCYSNKNVEVSDIESECGILIHSLHSSGILSSDNQHHDKPYGNITNCQFDQHITVSCQLSSSRRALLYLTYLWALNAFAKNYTFPLPHKQKKDPLLNIVTASLEGHGLIIRNDPRIPATLLHLSKRLRPYNIKGHS